MTYLKKLLIEEQDHLIKLLKQAQEHAHSVSKEGPEGSLTISSNKNSYRAYQTLNGKSIYIPKSNIELISKLAQKTYNKHLLNLLKKRLSQINAILVDYDDNEIDNLYLNEHPFRQKFITPVEVPWEQQLAEWISVSDIDYLNITNNLGFSNTPNPSNYINYSDNTNISNYSNSYDRINFPSSMNHPESLKFETSRGEKVRSKSEKILADYFHSKGIPYRYEKPLKLSNGYLLVPDFTFLSKRLREEKYWEHFGMMDNAEYAAKASEKINNYMKAGIMPGERLIMTFETRTDPLSTSLIKKIVEKYLFD